MFHADITFVLALIALVAGASLILSVKSHKGLSTGSCTFIGYAVIILSIIIILFSGYGMLRGHFMHRAIMRRMMHRGKRTPCMMMRKMQKPGQMPMQGPMKKKGMPMHR